MRQSKIGMIAGLVLIVMTGFPGILRAASEVSRATIELVRNGGCEDALEGGNIPHWVEVVGTNWTQRSSNPEPYEGLNYFFAGAGATAELRQDVNLSEYADLVDWGGQWFHFSAWVRSWDQSPADVSQIIVQYLDHNLAVLENYNLGQYSNTSAWVQVTHSSIAPVGARYYRIRLLSIRYAGTNNDGYFDAVSLVTEIPVLPAPQNLELSVQGDDLHLGWDPVTQDSSGNPVSVSEYRVYAGDDPDFICGIDTLIGSVASPEITMLGGAGMQDRKFFRVIVLRL